MLIALILIGAGAALYLLSSTHTGPWFAHSKATDPKIPTVTAPVSEELSPVPSLPSLGSSTLVDSLIHKWATRVANLSFAEIKAIVMVESSGDPNAMNPSDPSWGLMQVTPLIGRHFGGIVKNEELLNPDTNLKAGTGFLSELKRKYEKRFPLSDPGNGWVQMYNTGEPLFLNSGVRNAVYQQRYLKFLRQFGG